MNVIECEFLLVELLAMLLPNRPNLERACSLEPEHRWEVKLVVPSSKNLVEHDSASWGLPIDAKDLVLGVQKNWQLPSSRRQIDDGDDTEQKVEKVELVLLVLKD